MAKHKRPSSSRSQGMRARSSIRLRLECLETRAMLSAIGFSSTPRIAPPPLAALPANYNPIVEQQVVLAAIETADRNPVATPIAHPLLSSVDRPSPELADLSNVSELSNAPPFQVVSETNVVLTGDSAPLQLDVPIGTVVTITAFVPSLVRLGTGGIISESGANPSHDDVAEPSLVRLGTGGIISESGANLSYDDVAEPSLVRLGTRGIISESGANLSHDDGVRPSLATLSNEGSSWVLEITFTSTWLSLPNDPGQIGLSGPLDPSNPPYDSSVAGDIPTVIDPAASLAKSHGPGVPAASDTSYYTGRAGNQASTTAEPSLLIANSMASPPATTPAGVDATASNSTEGGFITLPDDTVASISRLGDTSSSISTLNGVRDAELAQADLLTGILLAPRTTADASSRSSTAARSTGNFVADLSSQPTAQPLEQPTPDAEEGGSIELAFNVPSLGGVDNGAPVTGPSTASDTAQQLSEIRTESGVGLFCDIEVATARPSPSDGSPSVAIPDRNSRPKDADMEVIGSKADAAAKPVPPALKVSRVTTSGLTDNLPILLGAAILVSRGGLRLEETVAQRERRLYCVEDLLRSPNQ